MMQELKDKVVIVVGAAGATGAAVAKAFVKNGAKVVIADIRKAELDKVAEDLKKLGTVEAVEVDVRNMDSVHAMVEKAVSLYGGLDAMVNAAGVMGNIAHRAELQDYDDDLFDDVIATDMTGAFYCVKAAAQQMVAQGRGGSITTVGSAKGLMPSKLQCAFSAAKAGMFNFTRAVGMEMAPDGIRINALAAGDVENEKVSKLDEESMKLMLSHIPAGRIAKPEDFAGICCFLATDAASYINGAIIPVDGAWDIGVTRDF